MQIVTKRGEEDQAVKNKLNSQDRRCLRPHAPTREDGGGETVGDAACCCRGASMKEGYITAGFEHGSKRLRHRR